MATHLNASGTTLTHPPIAAAWKPWSDAWTQLVQRPSPRRDLTVIVTPGAGQGSPACLTVADATIEVDATHLRIDPADIDPTDLTLRPLYATGWGLLVHEAAHATHTTWTQHVEDTCDPGHFDAAMLLEEPRCERQQIRRRPRDQKWLNAATTELLLIDLPPQISRAQAATAAAILLARADAGILTTDDTLDARRAIRTVLGGKLLAKLEKIWRHALRTRDDDHQAMIEWGRQWVRALGRDPHQPIAGAADTVRQAIEVIVAGILAGLAAETIEILNELARRRRAGETDTEQAIRKAAKLAADKVFGDLTSVPTRSPTDAERAASGKLTRALRGASLREPTVTAVTSPVPPGRLGVRAAMSEQVQRTMGQIPASEPWRHKRRKTNPRPPLHVGIAVDVSGSMSGFLPPAATATWLLANATSRLPGSAAATVLFGDRVRAITRPRQALAGVPILPMDGFTVGLVIAIDALDHTLGLSAGGYAARLLVVISDGDLLHDELRLAQGRLDRLAKTGCGLLWIGPEDSLPLRGGRAILADDTETVAGLITSAAVDALRQR